MILPTTLNLSSGNGEPANLNFIQKIKVWIFGKPEAVGLASILMLIHGRNLFVLRERFLLKTIILTIYADEARCILSPFNPTATFGSYHISVWGCNIRNNH